MGRYGLILHFIVCNFFLVEGTQREMKMKWKRYGRGGDDDGVIDTEWVGSSVSLAREGSGGHYERMKSKTSPSPPQENKFMKSNKNKHEWDMVWCRQVVRCTRCEVLNVNSLWGKVVLVSVSVLWHQSSSGGSSSSISSLVLSSLSFLYRERQGRGLFLDLSCNSDRESRELGNRITSRCMGRMSN